MKLGVRLLGTGASLPRRAVTTDALLAVTHTRSDPATLRARIGVDTRWWAEPDEDLVGLATTALASALDAAGMQAGDLRRIVLATSTGGDTLIPANAALVRTRLGTDDTCDAFDLNNACCGFLTALDLAARSVATGLGPVAVIAAELFSRNLDPGSPRSYLVMGDAAAAVIVGPAHGGGGVLATHLRSRDDLPGQMITPHPAAARSLVPVVIDAPHAALAASALDAIRGAGDHVLAAAGLGWADVDWFLPHQPNAELFERIVAACGVDPARTVPVARGIGSVGAASIPWSLDRLVRSGGLRAGQHVLLAAVGAGTAYGATLLEVD